MVLTTIFHERSETRSAAMMLIIIYLHFAIFPAHGCWVQAAGVWEGCVLEVTPLHVGAALACLHHSRTLLFLFCTALEWL